MINSLLLDYVIDHNLFPSETLVAYHFERKLERKISLYKFYLVLDIENGAKGDFYSRKILLGTSYRN